MSKTSSSKLPALVPLQGSFSVSLKELPFLQVFGLPFDSNGDIKVALTFDFPEGGKPVALPKYQPGNRGLVKITTTSNRVEIATQKIWRLSWDFFRKQFGAALVAFLAAPPKGTELTVVIAGKKQTQAYRGPVANGVWTWKAMSPAVPANALQAAWSIAALRFDKQIHCADDAEAEAIVAAAAKDKFLRGMEVKRNGLAISCKEDEGHLAALLFQCRHASDWQLPVLATKRAAPADAIEIAVANWRKGAAPNQSAMSDFESIRELLADVAKKGPLKSETQEFPPKYELFLPAPKGKHVWDFAAVAAVGKEVYFDLFPLGLDVSLRDRTSEGLRKKAYRPDDGFKLTSRDVTAFAEEIRALTNAAYEWFSREIVKDRPLPPCQPIDHSLIDPCGDLDADAGEEAGVDAYTGRATYHVLGADALGLLRRLDNAFGRGNWQRAELDLPARLPGWQRPCRLELHWYDRRNGKAREPWKIKRFLEGAPKSTPCGQTLVYAAQSAFIVSLERGKAYRCTGMLGRKLQAYVRIVDESGEPYWYPERFFVPAATTAARGH